MRGVGHTEHDRYRYRSGNIVEDIRERHGLLTHKHRQGCQIRGCHQAPGIAPEWHRDAAGGAADDIISAVKPSDLCADGLPCQIPEPVELNACVGRHCLNPRLARVGDRAYYRAFPDIVADRLT